MVRYTTTILAPVFISIKISLILFIISSFLSINLLRFTHELKRTNVNDTEEQKKKCEEQRRERIDFRNDEIVRQRLENDKGSKVNKRWY